MLGFFLVVIFFNILSILKLVVEYKFGLFCKVCWVGDSSGCCRRVWLLVECIYEVVDDNVKFIL